MKNLIISLIVVLTTSLILPASINAQRGANGPGHNHAHPANVKKALIAKKGTWSYLGKKTADIKADRDEMLVTAYEGSFTSLKLSVTNSTIHIKNNEVVFANNETKKFTIEQVFSENSSSKIFDLPGNKRVIKKIIFQYKTVGQDGGKAKVQVWGKH